MTDNDRPQFSSLTARIAALKEQGIDNSLQTPPKISKLEKSPSAFKQRPPPPIRPKTVCDSLISGRNSLVNTKFGDEKSITKIKVPLTPPFIIDGQLRMHQNEAMVVRPPPRRNPPALPARKCLDLDVQLTSHSSKLSSNSAQTSREVSNNSAKLPPTSQEEQAQIYHTKPKPELINTCKEMRLNSIKCKLTQLPKSISTYGRDSTSTAFRPKLPSRPVRKETIVEVVPKPDPHKNSPVAPSKSNPSIGSINESEGQISGDVNLLDNKPPPINLNTKPSIREIQNRESLPIRMKFCLWCKDFSNPDEIASQYSRESLPRTHDVLGYLATVLCEPFPSATDKARAIFSWLHHNIAYDVDAFFGNRVKNVRPEDTITSGLAVCGGYAGLFETIALKAGIDAITITGHGKGFGYTPMKPGDPVPPRKPSGHAWNAVRIDGGEWKLIDSCWGAGNVNGQNYVKCFSPSLFTCSNEEFGIRHFPQDPRHFFRLDGLIPTWEQYMRGLGPTDQEPVEEYGSVEDDYGISKISITPPHKYISLSSNDTSLRFQFRKVCEHLTSENNEQNSPLLFLLCIPESSNDQWLPFESNRYWWWLDVSTRNMVAGQRISCYTVSSMNGINVKNVTREEYIEKKGKCSMGFAGVCAWEIA